MAMVRVCDVKVTWDLSTSDNVAYQSFTAMGKTEMLAPTVSSHVLVGVKELTEVVCHLAAANAKDRYSPVAELKFAVPDLSDYFAPVSPVFTDPGFEVVEGSVREEEEVVVVE